jgi:hypothetical protein
MRKTETCAVLPRRQPSGTPFDGVWTPQRRSPALKIPFGDGCPESASPSKPFGDGAPIPRSRAAPKTPFGDGPAAETKAEMGIGLCQDVPGSDRASEWPRPYL